MAGRYWPNGDVQVLRAGNDVDFAAAHVVDPAMQPQSPGLHGRRDEGVVLQVLELEPHVFIDDQSVTGFRVDLRDACPRLAFHPCHRLAGIDQPDRDLAVVAVVLVEGADAASRNGRRQRYRRCAGD